MTPLLNTLIETLMNLLSFLLVTVIIVTLSRLSAKLAGRKELENLSAAIGEVSLMAAQTVDELQQTAVADLKSASADGKLSEEEIRLLGESLVTLTTAKLGKPVTDIITAAGVDLVALIRSAGESRVLALKQEA